MPEQIEKLQQELRNWAESAQRQGWLTQGAVDSLDTVAAQTPGSLFEQPNRPLVVGFFGGTGVGKSTLMNRFAGEQVARASAERPTSREITLYVHESVSIAKLPDEFPLQRMKTLTHSNERYRSVLWIDMPDFDSVEQSNRELVEHWLPHIDVVVYVVSPERYKDDNGWRLLQQHGSKHAWMFVINHWDRGDEIQRDDFARMLSQAGLDSPLLFCTDSSNNSDKKRDEFTSFQQAIDDIADAQLIQQLEEHGVVQRIQQLKLLSNRLKSKFATHETATELDSIWTSHWERSKSEFQDSVSWKLPSIAAQYVKDEPGLLAKLIARVRGKPVQPQELHATHSGIDDVLDDSFFDRVDEAIDDFSQQASVASLPVKTLHGPMSEVKGEYRESAHGMVQQALNASLAKPGSDTHRTLHKMLGWICWLLPLAALSWIGYRIVNVFRLGANDPAAYLSSNFAIHSVLLFALAWLVPTVLYIKLAPSREKAAIRGLRQGIEKISEHTSQQMHNVLGRIKADSQSRLEDNKRIWESVANKTSGTMPDSLRRMIMASTDSSSEL